MESKKNSESARRFAVERTSGSSLTGERLSQRSGPVAEQRTIDAPVDTNHAASLQFPDGSDVFVLGISALGGPDKLA